jgi:hypothetical protein
MTAIYGLKATLHYTAIPDSKQGKAGISIPLLPAKLKEPTDMHYFS